MQVPKPTDTDRARFVSLVPDDSRVVVKPMFGNLGAFVNGNMFMGLFGPHIGVKLDPRQLAELLAVAGGGPFGPTERPMGGYATLPALLSDETARQWTASALDYVAGLPAKIAKKK